MMDDIPVHVFIVVFLLLQEEEEEEENTETNTGIQRQLRVNIRKETTPHLDP